MKRINMFILIYIFANGAMILGQQYETLYNAFTPLLNAVDANNPEGVRTALDIINTFNMYDVEKNPTITTDAGETTTIKFKDWITSAIQHNREQYNATSNNLFTAYMQGQDQETINTLKKQLDDIHTINELLKKAYHNQLFKGPSPEKQ